MSNSPFTAATAWSAVLALCVLSSGCAATHWNESEAVVRGQDDEGISLGRGAGKEWLDKVTGKNAAANTPVAKNLPWFGAVTKDEAKAREFFFQGEEAFRQKRYVKAREGFEESASRLPNSPLEENALFMIAESFFFADEYGKAFEAYEALISKYKGSRHLDTVAARQFALGRYWITNEIEDPSWRLLPNWSDKKRPFIDTQGKALKAFEKVRLNHPTGPLADDSIMATAAFYFARSRYHDADYFYTLLRREYPNSDLQFKAHFLGIQAKIRNYQGSEYDGTPLAEAKKLIEQTIKQFPDTGQEDRERLTTLHAQVTKSLAERDFELAKYYEGNGYNGAAGSYYARLARDYPQTELAGRSQQKIAQIQGEPTTPPRRLTWISVLFPDEEEPGLQIENVAGGKDSTFR